MARNTLWMVIVLFAVYLVYEVSSMWFRSFPKGFYYAGYAHQGAFCVDRSSRFVDDPSFDNFLSFNVARCSPEEPKEVGLDLEL